MRRRWIPLVAISLAIGLIVNVLVAWGLSTWSTGDPQHANYDAPGVGWPARAPGDWPEPDMWMNGDGFGMRMCGAGANLHRLIDTHRLDPSVKHYSMIIKEYGWPWLALSRRRQWTQVMRSFQNEPMAWWEEGFETPHWVKPIHDSGIPVNPLWSGLVGNMCVYAAVAGGLAAGLKELRHRRRRSRGLCVACAYPVRGLVVCPECGEHVG